MAKIVFICRGNIYRSPIAKQLCNNLLRDGSFSESYGTSVIKNKNQGAMVSSFPNMAEPIRLLMDYKIDISHEYCKQIFPKHLINVKKVIVMAEKEEIPKWLKKYKYEYWDVPNPAQINKVILKETISLIEIKIKKLIKYKIK